MGALKALTEAVATISLRVAEGRPWEDTHYLNLQGKVDWKNGELS